MSAAESGIHNLDTRKDGGAISIPAAEIPLHPIFSDPHGDVLIQFSYRTEGNAGMRFRDDALAVGAGTKLIQTLSQSQHS